MSAILWIHELRSGKKYIANIGFHWDVELLCLEDVFAFLYFPFNGNFSRFSCSCYEKNVILMLKMQEDQDTLALELRSRKWSRCRQNLTIKKSYSCFSKAGETAVLNCSFYLHSDDLYSVKWYKVNIIPFISGHFENLNLKLKCNKFPRVDTNSSHICQQNLHPQGSFP